MQQLVNLKFQVNLGKTITVAHTNFKEITKENVYYAHEFLSSTKGFRGMRNDERLSMPQTTSKINKGTHPEN